MMRKATFASLILAAPLVFGCSALVDKELDDKPVQQDGGPTCLEAEFCQGKADGTDCSTSELPDHICVDFCCVPEGCGNGFLEAGEVCDDGNDVPGDGCDSDCTLSCVQDADCDDGEGCDGEETCVDNACQEGVQLPNGTNCALGTPDGGIIPATCQNGVCTTD